MTRRHHRGGINRNFLKANTAALAAQAEQQAAVSHMVGRGGFFTIPHVGETPVPFIGGKASQFTPNTSLGNSGPAWGTTTESSDKAVIVHVRSGTAELGGEVFDIGTGNGSAFRNPDVVGIRNHSPVPEGRFRIEERKGLFHGFRAWHILGTPGHSGDLFHPAEVRLVDEDATKEARRENKIGKKECIFRPEGESDGCVTLMNNEHGRFEKAMDRVRPKYAVIMNN